MPRFVPASVAELQRVGLFGALSGEELTRLAEDSERVELQPGDLFGGTHATVDVLLNGLARGGAGMLRPGDLADGQATAVTACVVVRCKRATVESLSTS